MEGVEIKPGKRQWLGKEGGEERHAREGKMGTEAPSACHRLSGRLALFRSCRNTHVIKPSEHRIPALRCIAEPSQLVYRGMVGMAGSSEAKKAAEHSAHSPSPELMEGKVQLFTKSTGEL